MSVAAIIPVKALDGAKQRLSAALDQPARAALVLWLLQRVILAVQTSVQVDHLAVVSPDNDVLARARHLGATALRQHTGDLNIGLELGREWALANGADTLLVLLGDLPLVRGADIAGMVKTQVKEQAARRPHHTSTGQVVLAPDRAQTGTNALLLRPPDCLPFAFGPDSCARHRALAHQLGLGLSLYHRESIAFDVDWIADLDELRASDMPLPPVLRDSGEAPTERTMLTKWHPSSQQVVRDR